MIAAIQMVVIGYGLQKHYQTFSRSWVVIMVIFNLLKSKLKKGNVEEDKEKEKEKGKNIELKVRKSSLKRFGTNTINCVC